MPQKPQPPKKVTKSGTTDIRNTIEYKMNKSEQLYKKLTPVIKAKSKINRPDTPLAFTPEPQKIDNTYVSKNTYQ